jgi:hypothetical protein
MLKNVSKAMLGFFDIFIIDAFRRQPGLFHVLRSLYSRIIRGYSVNYTISHRESVVMGRQKNELWLLVLAVAILCLTAEAWASCSPDGQCVGPVDPPPTFTLLPFPDIDWYSADGTEFVISTAAELEGFAHIVNGTEDSIWFSSRESRQVAQYHQIDPDNFSGKTVTLAADIDLSGYSWVPIGNFSNSFQGTFNGNGHIIKNLTINRPNVGVQGLFGSIVGGLVKDLGLEEVNITGQTWVGGVVGHLYNGSVVRCYSTGIVNGFGRVGGIAGEILTKSNVTNSYSTATINGYRGEPLPGGDRGGRSIGGVVGLLGGPGDFGCTGFSYNDCLFVPDISRVTNCYSTGMVSGNREVGGVVGDINTGSQVVNSAALNPSVTITIQHRGRVAGYTDGARPAFSNNIAYDRMTNDNGNAEWINKGGAAKDGVDITVNEIKADGTINGLFVDSVWTTQNGYLPGLFGKLVAMPEHLSGAASARFIPPRQATAAQLIKITGRTLTLRLPERGNVVVYALNGAKIRAFDLGQGAHTLRLNDLPRGMYVVRANSGVWNQAVRMLVK